MNDRYFIAKLKEQDARMSILIVAFVLISLFAVCYCIQYSQPDAVLSYVAINMMLTVLIIATSYRFGYAVGSYHTLHRIEKHETGNKNNT